MTSWLYIAAGAGFVGLLGLVVWLLTIIFRERKTPEDAPFIFNTLTNIDGYGRCAGFQTDYKPGKGGRHIIEFDSVDFNWDKVLNKKESPKARIIVGKNNLISFPKGTLSKDCNVIIPLPVNPEDLHPAVKKSAIGVGLMTAAKLADYENLVEKILREGSVRKDELLHKIGDGEISKELMNYFTTYVKDFMENTVNMKAKDKAQIPGGVGGNYQNG